MSELFDEVDEEVRREQLKKLWDQYSIYIIAAAILIVAAVAGWRGYRYLEAQKAAEAGAAFDAAIELAEQNKHAEARGRLRQARDYGACRIPHAGAVARGGRGCSP